MKAPSPYLCALLFGLTAAGCGTSEPLPESETLEYRACSADADCTVHLNGCCTCEEGGEFIGVNKDKAKAFHHEFSCIFAECEELDTPPPCGEVLASCHEGLCVASELASE